jgi:UDP-N-acetylmuramoyl-tripeptide--D-alanyl-D-alanine ligase
MMPLTLRQICEALGTETPTACAALVIQSICTDTRKITPGCLFIAIKGDSHDGHDHVQAAAAAGAVAAMVDRDVATDLPLIRVGDTRQAMGRLANYVRRQLKCTVIAVAGSNGKTGTKNLIHSVLKGSVRGSISPKSFNNDIGVPTTIFAADPADDYLVLEIGTNHPGEILNLTKIAEPDVAIITNIGNEHLEFLGDLHGVTSENAQITEGMHSDGLLICNGDYAPLLSAVRDYPGIRITFGAGPPNDIQARDIRTSLDGVRFNLVRGQRSETSYHRDTGLRPVRTTPEGTSPFQTDASRTGQRPVSRGSSLPASDNLPLFIPLLGSHTAINALAAIAVGQHLGLSDEAIRTGLATATGPEMRLQLQSAGSVRILNDAYNANPNSMRAALETLRDVETQGRRVAILGDMFELGPVAIQHHRDIGRFAASCDLDQIICIGKLAELFAQVAREAGMPANRVAHFAASSDCAAAMSALVREDDLILLKASNGMKLWTLIPSISAVAQERSLRRVVAGREKAVMVEDAPVGEQIGR